MINFISSAEFAEISWSDKDQFASEFGVKTATSLAIPREWTPPFLAFSFALSIKLAEAGLGAFENDKEALRKLKGFLETERSIIVRSSVIGESIWDRGTYESVVVHAENQSGIDLKQLVSAANKVLKSTGGRPAGLMVQRYIRPTGRGEFGNLLRISKTRDHWEVTTSEGENLSHRQRLNSQRDTAADPLKPLSVRSGISKERLFGSIGAWLNNDLLLGKSGRLNCEWVTDNRYFYLVQVDQEDEDLVGINPRQLRIEPASQPAEANGKFLKIAALDALSAWDKLKVLEELWEPEATHKPILFYLPLADLPKKPTQETLELLSADFKNLIGNAGIVVRTSVRANAEKIPNLKRTDCMTAEDAAKWCLETKTELAKTCDADELAFVAHRFVAARSSAWVRADPGNPTVEINALWGLPDALQYCPFDIWEVHVPTASATDYPEYKSEMLIPKANGGWEYARVKNEIARTNSILSTEAKDLAARSHAISERLGKPCHIMWFVGCIDRFGNHFNIPWYWTPAHETERNPDRSAFRVVSIGSREDLNNYHNTSHHSDRVALELRPTDLALMRDTDFIIAVGSAALQANIPIILAGSTLGHAYYQLRKLGCTVVTPSEKRHERKRKSESLGKLVRDKIPEKIAQRKEAGVTRRIDGKVRKSFLVTKLLEEALEVREAANRDDKLEELADVFEVLRALANAEGLTLSEVQAVADLKAQKAGGFEEGLVLLETALTGPTQSTTDMDANMSSVLGDQIVAEAAEIPFSFFGFMKIDEVRAIHFEDAGVRAELVLRPDRLVLRLVKTHEQLDFDLNDNRTDG